MKTKNVYKNYSSADQNLNVVPIVGTGIVTSFGVGINSFNSALQNTECLIDNYGFSDDANIPLLMSRICNFNLNEELAKLNINKQSITEISYILATVPISIQAAVLAAFEAYHQAKLDDAPVAPHRIGIITAGSNLSQRLTWEQFKKHQTTPINFASPRWSLQFLDSYLLSIVSSILKIRGPGITASAASASSHAALMEATMWVKCGIVDVCFVLGAMADLSPLEWGSLCNAGALGGRSFADSPTKASRPFDANHEGFIPGQATACVVLESYESTLARQSGVCGNLLSIAMGLDGNRYADPNLVGEFNVMNKALNMANLPADKIDYINAHGTSTPKGDTIELEAINQLFNNSPWVNSTKSIVGHCLWSAGIVELIAVILQMNNCFVHGNRNLDNPIQPKCNLVGQKKQEANIEYALSNAFGFGGINSSLVVAKK